MFGVVIREYSGVGGQKFCPLTQAIVGKESDKMIKDVQLKVKMKTLTLKGIQELLQPQQVIEKYREYAPFMWKLLSDTVIALKDTLYKMNLPVIWCV